MEQEIYEHNENQCAHKRQDLHTCPFRSEILDDFTLCNCCQECMNNCADDI